MKAIWNGSLTFGLVSIPIRVYPATEEHLLEFHMLHGKDLSPIRFARICKEENKEIPYSDIIKGYEIEKGEYIPLEEEDFKAANAEKTSMLNILHFTNSPIHPMYFEKPYFLEPDKKAGKAYLLLSEALFKSKKVAIANFVFRNREHIGAIFSFKEGLILIQMRYHAEIRPFEKLELPKVKITNQELSMALSLIEQLTEPFKPEKHHDTYIEDLMEIIEQKAKGKRRKKVTPKKPSYETRDLMHLLKESMEKALDQKKEKKREQLTHRHSPKPEKRTRKTL